MVEKRRKNSYEGWFDELANLCFKTAVHADDERIISERQDVSLGEHLLHLIPQHKIMFSDLLHGEPQTRFFMSHQMYGTAKQQHYQLSFIQHNHSTVKPVLSRTCARFPSCLKSHICKVPILS